MRKDGTEVVYERHLLRRSFRNAQGKPDKETLANLSPLPAEAIEAIRKVLAGRTLVDAAEAFTVCRSLPHGHVAAVYAMAKRLGLPQLLGPPCRQRDLAFALVVSRVVRPRPKLSTLAWWPDTTLGADLGVADASITEVYQAMDWLGGRQETIEAQLAARHLDEGGMALFDLSSCWVEGNCCELAARGYSRDGKKGNPQIEYGLLTDPVGRPVAIRVLAGNIADPAAFVQAVTLVRTRFGLQRLIMVGDRGMITSARVTAIKDDPDNLLGWITCLRAPAIAALAADDGPRQMTLFDTHDIAELTHPDYPSERLIACRNPALALERARKRDHLLTATEQLLAKVKTRVDNGTLSGQDNIGVAVGEVINKHKMAKHFQPAITDTALTWQRDQTKIATEAALDGIYVIRAGRTHPDMTAADLVTAHKSLSNVERDFRSVKTTDLDVRPIHHYLTGRVQAHMLICMLALYLTWHLRKTWAPLTYTDEHPPTRENPVAPAKRSTDADRKAARRTTDDGQPLHSFRGLLDHLATLTRNTTLAGRTIDILSTPTQTQRRAFQLLDTAVPLTLT